MNLADARPGLRVRYVPGHAKGDVTHPDCEDGTVTSVNDVVIFVRFKPGHGYGIACTPSDLVVLPLEPAP